MINREAGLVEIYDRIYAQRDTLNLKAFKRTPTIAVDESFLPCIFMMEGTDEVIEHSSRNQTGYPCRRALEITLELVTDGSPTIKQIYTDVRTVVCDGVVVVADNNTFIREIRTEGPTGYGLPDVLGMRLVLALVYTDNGNINNP